MTGVKVPSYFKTMQTKVGMSEVIDAEYTIIKEDNKEDIKSITHNAETETCNRI